MSSDVEAFLTDHPLIERVEFLFPDLVGVARGKRVGISELHASLSGHGLFSTTLYALDTMGANVDRSGLVWEEGDADRPVYLDPTTLRLVPWRPDRAQVIGGLCDHDGSPFFADPRHVLTQRRDALRATGKNPVCAIELEFYLLDGALSPDGLPQVERSATSLHRTREPHVYRHERLDEAEDFFDLLTQYCEAQDLPIKGAVSEFAPGQFEVNLSHVDDAVRACDDALMFKRCAKAAARATGRFVSFMAKPFAEQSGSGLHCHVSLVDEGGANLFAVPETGDGMLRHCISGLQAVMSESTLLFAPNANSYRRLQPMSYAPITPSWGYNNRTVALRIPAGGGQARRIEHRTAGADANMYLVLAAVLAGMEHGLTSQGDPGEPVRGNAYALDHLETIPTDWSTALGAFETAQILPDYLGREFCRLYAACRRAEFDRFQAQVSPLEIEWYLTVV